MHYVFKLHALLRGLVLACPVLALGSSAGAWQDVAYDASAGLPPGSAEPPWQVSTSVYPASQGPSQAIVSYSPAGVVLDASARQGDSARMSQDFSSSGGPVPSVLYFETEFALAQPGSGSFPVFFYLNHPGTPGDWQLAIGSNDLVLENRYATSTSHGLMSASASIGSTSPFRHYRLEIDTTTDLATLQVDGVPVLTLQGSTSPGFPTFPQFVQGNVTGASAVIRRMEHNFGGEQMTICPWDSATSTAPVGMNFVGSAELTAGGATFAAGGLPALGTVIPLVSARPTAPVSIGRMQGLCLGRPFFRYLPGGQVPTADASGQLTFTIDPGAVPTIVGPRALQSGDSLYVQMWYRDPGMPVVTGMGNAMRIQFR